MKRLKRSLGPTQDRDVPRRRVTDQRLRDRIHMHLLLYSREVIYGLGAFLAVLIVVFAVVSAVVLRNVSEIDSNSRVLRNQEREDVRLARAADYRLCARANTSRAEIHADVRQFGRAFGADAEGVREARIPINDCSPNLQGNAAVPLARVEQRRYVTFFVENNAPPRIVSGRVVRQVDETQYAPPFVPPVGHRPG